MADVSGRVLAVSLTISFLIGTIVGYKCNTLYRQYLQNKRDRLRRQAVEIQTKLSVS